MTLTFDIKFQGQTLRSQYWCIFFRTPRHRFSIYRHQKQVSKIYTDIYYQIYHIKCVTSCLTLNFKVNGQGHNIDIYVFWIQRHRFSTYRHETQVSTIYTTRDIILNVLCHIWPWISRSKVKVTILAYIFLNSATLIQYFKTPNTSFYDIYYQRYHIECVMSCLTLNFKVESQGHNHEIYFFWISWHPFSNRGHQTQVSMTYTTRDIKLNALRHVWPWISRSKVKITILAYIFLNFLTSI